MRSTARRPAPHAGLYRRLREDARLAETLGFHSLWFAEHHFWYDGWCPAPLTAAAYALGATSELRVGTGVHLLPLWDVATERSVIDTVIRLAGERLELGVGLGYRDDEYNGLAVLRGRRGRLMDAALDELVEHWSHEGSGPPIMVGGFSEAAIRRAGTRGLGIFLPFSLSSQKLRTTLDAYREQLAVAGRSPGRIAMLKYAWATDGSSCELELAQRAIAASAREYSGAWFPLRGRLGFNAPELLEKQLRLAVDNAFIGEPQHIAEQIAELDAAGVDVVVLQVTRDDLALDHRRNMEILAEGALPAVQPR